MQTMTRLHPALAAFSSIAPDVWPAACLFRRDCPPPTPTLTSTSTTATSTTTPTAPAALPAWARSERKRAMEDRRWRPSCARCWRPCRSLWTRPGGGYLLGARLLAKVPPALVRPPPSPPPRRWPPPWCRRRRCRLWSPWRLRLAASGAVLAVESGGGRKTRSWCHRFSGGCSRLGRRGRRPRWSAMCQPTRSRPPSESGGPARGSCS
mmetsp:Transcript_75975/g.217625  ORF Transcript_75975/g.217625 Transcript_75975/m.217625 type:complete len:208 (+) Transcript_75975:113-736(+)